MSEVGRQRKNLLFSRRRCWRLADNGKINHEKGMFSAAALTFPFLNSIANIYWHEAKDVIMDKRRAIQIMTKAAKLYQDNLEDQKVLFLYGLPSEVKKQLQTEEKDLSCIQGYEVAFHRYNFLHLTGVKLNKSGTASAIHFYQKCLDNRLTESDFIFAKDGSTGQKLDILESMMLIKKNVTMIGDFTDRGSKLFSEKAAGNVCGCIGFVQDRNTKLNVPNTLLKKDIRDVTAQPTYKVFAVVSKTYQEDKYSKLVKLDKSIDIKECHFSGKIEKLLERDFIQV